MKNYIVYAALLIAGGSSGLAAYLVAPLPHSADRPSGAASYPQTGVVRARMARQVAETAAREAARAARETIEERYQARKLAAN